MKSYEALREAIAGKTVEHAKELHLSTILVNKWQEPTNDFEDSGAFNPLDRVETIVKKSLELGILADKAITPIQYLASQFNCVLISIPKETRDLKAIAEEFARTIKEFSDVSGAYAEAIKDSRISGIEANMIDTEIWHLVQQAILFLQKVKESVK